jgi:hypothetical protein
MFRFGWKQLARYYEMIKMTNLEYLTLGKPYVKLQDP